MKAITAFKHILGEGDFHKHPYINNNSLLNNLPCARHCRKVLSIRDLVSPDIGV